ncbi:MAG: hypothetical protein D6762_08005 [Candidatus Neomarinimicrobiota bacterium]|nr:MAG: hypothetical protein D6762_08005 [Candidatus Neomarinimicrobiota bacterium]
MKQRNFLSRIGLIGLGASVLFLLSCDDRVPHDSALDYSISMHTAAVAYDANNDEVAIGEDLKGNATLTKVTVTLLDNNGTAASGRTIAFSAQQNGNPVGSFDPVEVVTNAVGQAVSYFADNDHSGDITLKASLNADTKITQTITIIDTAVTTVWPYYLNMSASNSTIQVDNGQTWSDVTALVTNRRGFPIPGLAVRFTLNPPDIGVLSAETVLTDSAGKATVRFEDTGNVDHVGTAAIQARFAHPLFGTLTDSVQVSIASPVNYVLTANAIPVAIDLASGDRINVGEDVAGPDAYTLIVATLKDQNGNPVAGQLLSFSPTVLGAPSGSLDIYSTATNSDGLASVLFEDGGAAVDNPGTPTYEGVVVLVQLNEDIQSSARFNVYAGETDVWPYRIILSTDTDVIQLDNGATKAQITARLLNRANRPLPNLEIAFNASLGFIAESAITDSTGSVVTDFTDLGNPEDVGISTIQVAFDHPSFGSVSDSLLISIEDPSFSGTPAYIEIPPSNPNRIMVVGGGGRESTTIKAEVYDENGVLVDSPTLVTFTLGPNVPEGANLNNAGISDTAYTVNGVASVSLNSGTRPGPVRVTASVELSDGSTITATRDNQAIIVTGPAYYIFPDTDPTSLEPIGGGMYRMEVAAMVYDLWFNPVADTTGVYWTLEPSPLDSDSILQAFVEGVSFTGNENLSGQTYSGVAFSTVVYPSRDIFSIGRLTAMCFGGDIDGDGVYGDSVVASVENDVMMPFFAGNLLVTVNPAFWDFTTMSANPNAPTPAPITITATLTDFYNNPVEHGHLMFAATGASDLQPPNPVETDANGQATVVGIFDPGICIPQPNTDPQLYQDFTATVTVTLIDPIMITSEPVEILFIRSPIIP